MTFGKVGVVTKLVIQYNCELATLFLVTNHKKNVSVEKKDRNELHLPLRRQRVAHFDRVASPETPLALNVLVLH
jgi:hypothetical protein